MVSEPINAEELNAGALKEFLDSFDYVFSDCDGVIWTIQGPMQGAGRFFELMKKFGKTIHYVSNNSLRSKDNYTQKFKSADIEDGFENLTIPSVAIAEYLKSKNFTKKVYAVACAETVKVLEAQGLECVTGPLETPDHYKEFVEYLKDDESIGAVVFDSDFRVNLPKLYKASTYLRRPDVLYLNGATDKLIPLMPGISSLGTGPFTDIVTEYIKREPIAMGKPGKLLGEYAMKRAGATDPSRILFIGDMLVQDVGLGKATGFKTLLVLTSHTKEFMMSNPVKPDYYATDLGSIVPLIEKLLTH